MRNANHATALESKVGANFSLPLHTSKNMMLIPLLKKFLHARSAKNNSHLLIKIQNRFAFNKRPGKGGGSRKICHRISASRMEDHLKAASAKEPGGKHRATTIPYTSRKVQKCTLLATYKDLVTAVLLHASSPSIRICPAVSHSIQGPGVSLAYRQQRRSKNSTLSHACTS